MDAASRNHYLADFERAFPALPGSGVPWLMRARRSALERFAESGFPTTRDEDWKYTSVAAIEKRPFAAAAQPLAGISAAQVGEFAFADCHLLVFVNGHHVPALSRVLPLPQGVAVADLAQTLAAPGATLEAALSGNNGGGFAALNSAFMQSGAYIHVPDHVALEQPVHLLFLADAPDAALHLRNLIVVGAHARATIIEHYAGTGGTAYLTNAVTQIVAGNGAQIEHCKLQQESAAAFHVAALHAQQGQDSSFTSHSIALGGALARSDIATRFSATGCAAAFNGLYLADGRQHVDHHTTIDHAMPHGTSREFYRGIVGGAARAVFNGKVIVRENAQASDARQTNHNLLLSDDAEVDTKPQLEIYADDVKCAHGATVGQLDRDMIFYLRARGIAEETARSLLTYAFAQDIVARIGLPQLRARLENILLARLPQGDAIRSLL